MRIVFESSQHVIRLDGVVVYSLLRPHQVAARNETPPSTAETICQGGAFKFDGFEISVTPVERFSFMTVTLSDCLRSIDPWKIEGKDAEISPKLALHCAPEALRTCRHFDMRDAELGKGVNERICDGRKRTNATGFARAFYTERIGPGRHRIAFDTEAAKIACSRHGVIHE